MTHDEQATTTLVQSSAPCHEARALTKGGQVATILLDDHVYTLRITRAGKLILTK